MKPALVEPGLDVIREGMPFPEWRAQAPRLGRVYRAMGWVVADWIIFGEGRYGEVCGASSLRDSLLENLREGRNRNTSKKESGKSSEDGAR